MNDSFLTQFPPAEQEQRRKINALMEAWKKELSGVQVLFREDGKYYAGSEYFCADGFFPYYYRQKKKILFIGRETVNMPGADYIEVILGSYRENSLGKGTVDQHIFSKRMLQIAWGILQGGTVPYEEVPQASELGRTFAAPEGISFAFMELSKYSNDNADGNARRDSKLMTAFLKDSKLEKRNFFREELDILDPDLVITMNLWAAGIDRTLLRLALGEVVEQKAPDYRPNAALNVITINARQVPLIDMFHFSAVKNTEESFYTPAMKIVRDLAQRRIKSAV
jgi:hypothetical protein